MITLLLYFTSSASSTAATATTDVKIFQTVVSNNEVRGRKKVQVEQIFLSLKRLLVLGCSWCFPRRKNEVNIPRRTSSTWPKSQSSSSVLDLIRAFSRISSTLEGNLAGT